MTYKSSTKRAALRARTEYLDALAEIVAGVVADEVELHQLGLIKRHLADVPLEGLKQFVFNRLDGVEWHGSSKLSKAEVIGVIVENWVHLKRVTPEPIKQPAAESEPANETEQAAQEGQQDEPEHDDRQHLTVKRLKVNYRVIDLHTPSGKSAVRETVKPGDIITRDAMAIFAQPGLTDVLKITVQD